MQLIIIFLASDGNAASSCGQAHINDQNCPTCQLPAQSESPLKSLQANLPSLSTGAVQATVTEFIQNVPTVGVLSVPPFRPSNSITPLVIDVDPKELHQKMWGYGAALTDSCVTTLNRMSPPQRGKLMLKIFDRKHGAGFNYLRVPAGANDFSPSEYTFDDTPGNQPDPSLSHFDFSKEAPTLKLLKEAKKINPEMQFMMSPWSAPAWMKSTSKLDGGVLLPQYYEVYSAYLIKTLEAFQKNGVPIDTMSVLNEPLIGTAATHWGFEQMYISQAEMGKLISGYLAPMMEAEQKAGRLKTRLLLHDHNWNNATYVGKLLDDKTIASQTAGVAFHCYYGNPNDMYKAMASHPDVPMFNTECSGTSDGSAVNSSSFQWWMKNEALNVTRRGVVGTVGWNLCLDNHDGPHNPGGCKDCRGLISVDEKNNAVFNSEFDALAQMSRYVRRDAVRIGTNDLSDSGIANAAFKNPDGSTALVISNDQKASVSLTVRNANCETTTVTVPANGAISLVWE